MIFAVGDIHGRYDLLLDMHKKITDYAAQKDEEHTIIFLGDYIDRGPQSKEVLDFLMSEPFEGFRHHFLLGNHEQMFIDAMEGWQPDLFLANGGHQTLDSFKLDDLMSTTLEPYKDWLKTSLDHYHREDNFLFIHAGIDPRRDFSNTHYSTFIWIRDEFLKYDNDYMINDESMFVIHGHTPVNYDKPIKSKFFLDEIEERENPKPFIKHNRMNLDTGGFWTGVISAAVIDDKKLIGYFVSNNDTLTLI